MPRQSLSLILRRYTLSPATINTYMYCVHIRWQYVPTQPFTSIKWTCSLRFGATYLEYEWDLLESYIIIIDTVNCVPKFFISICTNEEKLGGGGVVVVSMKEKYWKLKKFLSNRFRAWVFEDFFVKLKGATPAVAIAESQHKITTNQTMT